MANLDRLICDWSNFTGAPGYTSFTFSTSQGPSMQPKVITFFQALLTYLPTGYKVHIPNGGPTVDETNGQLVNTWVGGTDTTLTATGAGTFGPLSGAIVKWDTGRIADGHHVRGRTFIVPLVDSTHSTQGLIGSATTTAIHNAASALYSLGGQLVVWHRPKFNQATTPPTLIRPGIAYPVVSDTVPAKLAYLSSRRD